MPKLRNIGWELKKLKKLWRAVLIIAVSILLAFGVTKFLEISHKPTFLNPFPKTAFVVSPEPRQFNVSVHILPSYFSSAFEVCICQCSPYATNFPVLKIEMSLDNSSWVEIPLLNRSSLPEDYNQFADLGLVEIDKPTLITIYGRYFFPEQSVNLPSGVSKEMLFESLKSQIVFNSQITPRDRVLEILVFFTLFSVFLQIIRFGREEWSKKKQLSENEMQSSKDRSRTILCTHTISFYFFLHFLFLLLSFPFSVSHVTYITQKERIR